LRVNEWLRSRNGLFHAVLQRDANFVIYRGDWLKAAVNTSMWSTNLHLNESSEWSLTMLNTGGGGVLVFTDNYWQSDWVLAGENVWAVLADDGNLFLAPNGDWSQKGWSTDVTDTLGHDLIKGIPESARE
jgi:hypothetical protein